MFPLMPNTCSFFGYSFDKSLYEIKSFLQFHMCVDAPESIRNLHASVSIVGAQDEWVRELNAWCETDKT